jgi:hypothetical protein
MIRFASSAMLTNSAPFSKDDVINGTLADAARRDEAGYLWIEADGSPECLRFYGCPAGTGECLPLVWLDGDVIDGGSRIDGDIVVGDWYSKTTPLAKQLECEMYAAALARPFIYLARPGCHGSSGDHAQRRREREVLLIDNALNQLKEAFGWGHFDLVLLRHKLRCPNVLVRAPQHGHRGKLSTSASINRMRMVAIEFGM